MTTEPVARSVMPRGAPVTAMSAVVRSISADRIWLATVDGLTPSAAQHEELEQLLRAGQVSGPASEDADDAGAPDATEESA